VTFGVDQTTELLLHLARNGLADGFIKDTDNLSRIQVEDTEIEHMDGEVEILRSN
jgi:hypothetical protein